MRRGIGTVWVHMPQLCKTFIWEEKCVYKNNLHFRKTNGTIQTRFYSNRTDLQAEKEKMRKDLELDVTNQLLLRLFLEFKIKYYN